VLVVTDIIVRRIFINTDQEVSGCTLPSSNFG
jgi:hypothetical protein